MEFLFYFLACFGVLFSFSYFMLKARRKETDAYDTDWGNTASHLDQDHLIEKNIFSAAIEWRIVERAYLTREKELCEDPDKILEVNPYEQERYLRLASLRSATDRALGGWH